MKLFTSLTSAPLPLTEVDARRSRAICPRSGISSVGSVRICFPWLTLMPWTRYTLPVSGLDSSGVVAVTLPTTVLALQPTAPPWTAFAVANGHTTLLLLGSRAKDSGSVTFAESMLMSTYLVAFIVGPLEATDPVDVDGVPLRIVHRAGQGDLTAFALESGADLH